jgi:hypothetical protein
VDQGGNLFALTFDQLWYEFDDYEWYSNSNNVPDSPPPPDSPPSPINTPYLPSADGSTLTGTSGSLNTSDGVWTIGSGSKIFLNGVLLRAGFPFGLAVSELKVDAHGQMFALDTSSVWHYWAGGEWQPTTGPASGPVPISIAVSRSSAGIPHSSALGTVMATLTVNMSDGSTFAGTYSIGLDGNGNTSGAMSGSNLVYNFAYSSSTVAIFNVTATQNGSSFSLYFDEQIA